MGIYIQIYLYEEETHHKRLEKTRPTERDGSDTDPDIGIHCHDIGRTKPTPGPFLGSQKITQNMMKETFSKHIVRGTRYILYCSTGVSSRVSLLRVHIPCVEQYGTKLIRYQHFAQHRSNLGLARPQKNKDN